MAPNTSTEEHIGLLSLLQPALAKNKGFMVLDVLNVPDTDWYKISASWKTPGEVVPQWLSWHGLTEHTSNVTRVEQCPSLPDLVTSRLQGYIRNLTISEAQCKSKYVPVKSVIPVPNKPPAMASLRCYSSR